MDALKSWLAIELEEMRLHPEDRQWVQQKVDDLERHHPYTGQHSLYIGRCATDIVRYLHPGEKTTAITLSGVLHDVGKLEFSPAFLDKSAYTLEDLLAIQEHVIIGVRMVKPRFPVTAEIIRRSHRHQKNGYPEIPQTTAFVSDAGLLEMIDRHARYVSLADHYHSAISRVNASLGLGRPLSREEAIPLLKESKPGDADLIDRLYSAGVL